MAPKKSTSKTTSKTTGKTTRKSRPKAAAKPKSPRRPSRRSKQATAPATKKKADAAAKAAKDAGATGKRLTSVKQQLRDSAIVARRAQGVTTAVIAAEFDVTTRTVERVVAGRRGVRSPLEDTPMQLLEDLATGFRMSIGDFEAMSVAWFDVNQSAALGAKKAADETRARLATLLSDVGKLPTDLEAFRSEMEMQRIAEQMVSMMRRVAAGECDASEAVEFFRGLIGGQQPVQIAESAEA